MSSLVPQQIINLLSSDLGIIVLIGVCVLEGMMLLYFMPSELLVPAGLFVFGTSIEQTIGIVIAVSMATTFGQIMLFLIAGRMGKKALMKQNWFKISEDRIETYESWFDKWGIGLIPITNVMPFVRGLATVPAGFSNLSPIKFALLSLTSSTVFQSILAVLYIVGFEYLTVG
jgi:membrane protein DedA with SNARE-associated domain